MQPAWDWFTKLKAQAPLLGEDPDFTAWFQNGEIDVACTISSNAREARNNGIKVDWTVPTEGATMDTDCLWIPKGLPEADLYWTKQYINYAISPAGQQAWLDPARPSRRGARPQAAGRPRRRHVLPDHMPSSSPSCSSCSPSVQVEHQSDWFAKFKEIMQS